MAFARCHEALKITPAAPAGGGMSEWSDGYMADIGYTYGYYT